MSKKRLNLSSPRSKIATFAESCKAMRVLLINTSERAGGAAIAASRLLEALKNNGIKAKLLVRDKQTQQVSVVPMENSWRLVWNFLWERVVIWATKRFSKKDLYAVDIANTGSDITSLPEFRQADVIHLHWINQGMLSLKNIREIVDSGKPVVWTMHDMWPCTGICHYSGSCTRYQRECDSCPFINGGSATKDLSWKVFQKKHALYQQANITFVTCSQWLKGVASKSALLIGKRIESIPNPINTNFFKPRSKPRAREKCGLPQDKKLILFGSAKITDKRKGIDYLISASQLLAEKYPAYKDQLMIVVFGKKSQQLEEQLPFPVHPLNYVNNEHDLVDIYNAVDLFLIPSLEDNLPNTIMEAMACGTPCVGFQTGGIPEMIDHLHNGYVADYRSTEDLANGIHWTLDESEYTLLSEQAVRKVTGNYSERAVAKKYIDIYNQITGNHA